MTNRALIKQDIEVNSSMCLKNIWVKYYQVYTLNITIKDNELLTIFKDQLGNWTTATRTPKENKKPKFKIWISGVRLLAMLYTKRN